MDRVPILSLGDVLLVSIQIDLQDDVGARAAGGPGRAHRRHRRPRRRHRHLGRGDRRLVHRADVRHDRVAVEGARRRDRRRRHAAGGRDHAGRAGAVAAGRAHRARPRDGPRSCCRQRRAERAIPLGGRVGRRRRRRPPRPGPERCPCRNRSTSCRSAPATTSSACARPCARRRQRRAALARRPDQAGHRRERAGPQHAGPRRRGAARVETVAARRTAPGCGPSSPTRARASPTWSWPSPTATPPAAGSGSGSAASRRLVDEFVLDTAVGQGTTVTVIKWRR